MHGMWRCFLRKHQWGEIRRSAGTQYIKYRTGAWEPMYEMRCGCCGRIKSGTKRELKYIKGDKR